MMSSRHRRNYYQRRVRIAHPEGGYEDVEVDEDNIDDAWHKLGEKRSVTMERLEQRSPITSYLGQSHISLDNDSRMQVAISYNYMVSSLLGKQLQLSSLLGEGITKDIELLAEIIRDFLTGNITNKANDNYEIEDVIMDCNELMMEPNEMNSVTRDLWSVHPVVINFVEDVLGHGVKNLMVVEANKMCAEFNNFYNWAQSDGVSLDCIYKNGIDIIECLRAIINLVKRLFQHFSPMIDKWNKTKDFKPSDFTIYKFPKSWGSLFGYKQFAYDLLHQHELFKNIEFVPESKYDPDDIDLNESDIDTIQIPLNDKMYFEAINGNILPVVGVVIAGSIGCFAYEVLKYGNILKYGGLDPLVNYFNVSSYQYNPRANYLLQAMPVPFTLSFNAFRGSTDGLSTSECKESIADWNIKIIPHFDSNNIPPIVRNDRIDWNNWGSFSLMKRYVLRPYKRMAIKQGIIEDFDSDIEVEQDVFDKIKEYRSKDNIEDDSDGDQVMNI